MSQTASMEAKISSKNQIVIPKEVRESLHLNPLDKVKFIKKDGIILLCKVEENPIKALEGIFKKKGKKKLSDLFKKERAAW